MPCGGVNLLLPRPCRAPRVSICRRAFLHRTLQPGKKLRCARISNRNASLSPLLFLSCLKNSSRTLTTITLTLTPSASAHSLSLVRASAPIWRS